MSWRDGAIRVNAANALTLARFALAAGWIVIFSIASERRAAFAAIASIAAASDYMDGWLARRLGVADDAGRWLDSIADVTFVLAALGCEAAAHAVPAYVPALIAVSFAQYAIDSVLLHRASAPIRSRLGHWGGVINYAIVLTLAFAPRGSIVAAAVPKVAPAIAAFYLAAIAERAMAYRAR